MAEANSFGFSSVADFSPQERAAFLVSGLDVRPEDIQKLEIPGGDSDGRVRRAVASLFDRLEGKFALSLSDIGKVRTLFESPDAGYEAYALDLLRKRGIDPNHLPEGSAPFWESPEAALAELLRQLTPAHCEVIQRDYTEPAIVVKPIRAHEVAYVKDESETCYDRRMVGKTPFYVSEWSAAYLNQTNADNNVGSMDGNRIVGWRIGIADKAEVTKVLATDGDVNTKPLKDRARDFHAEGGHGAQGFSSVMDYPVLYGLMMDESRQSSRPIDDVGASDGVWTMGTKLYGAEANVYDPNKDDYPRVAGGYWDRDCGNAGLIVNVADSPSRYARVRLAVMFEKA